MTIKLKWSFLVKPFLWYFMLLMLKLPCIIDLPIQKWWFSIAICWFTRVYTWGFVTWPNIIGLFMLTLGISMQKHTKSHSSAPSATQHPAASLRPLRWAKSWAKICISQASCRDNKEFLEASGLYFTLTPIKHLRLFERNTIHLMWGGGICKCQAGCLWIKNLMVEAWWCLTWPVLGSFSLLNSPSLTPEHRAKQGDVTWELIPAVWSSRRGLRGYTISQVK